MFKNAIIYTLHDSTPGPVEAADAAMRQMAARPLGGSEARRIGWRAPAGRNAEQMLHEMRGQRFASALIQERILPISVVKEEVAERVAQREADEGRRVSRAERNDHDDAVARLEGDMLLCASTLATVIATVVQSMGGEV